MLDALPPAILQVPRFHDGRLNGLSVAKGSARLSLQTSDGTPFEIRLAGVERLRADEFLVGNIVLHLEIVQGAPPMMTNVAARLEHLFPSPHPSAAPDFRAAREGRLLDAAERIRSGEAALVSLECSYGCDLVALCSEVHLSSSCEPDVSDQVRQ